MVVFTRCASFRAPIWYLSGGGGTREAGGTVTESLVGHRSTRTRTVARSIGRVSTRFGGCGEQLGCRRVRRVLNHCARESKAQPGRFLRGNTIPNHGLFFSYESQQGVANGQDSRGCLSGIYRALDEWILDRAPASSDIDPRTTIFLISAFIGSLVLTGPTWECGALHGVDAGLKLYNKTHLLCRTDIELIEQLGTLYLKQLGARNLLFSIFL